MQHCCNGRANGHDGDAPCFTHGTHPGQKMLCDFCCRCQRGDNENTHTDKHQILLYLLPEFCHKRDLHKNALSETLRA